MAHGLSLYKTIPKKAKYDAIIVAVAHEEFKKMDIKKIRSFTKTKNVIYDLKDVLPKDNVDYRL